MFELNMKIGKWETWKDNDRVSVIADNFLLLNTQDGMWMMDIVVRLPQKAVLFWGEDGLFSLTQQAE